ncbi:MAG TPA: arylsulfatase [Verrucomicrobiae bacterium]|nr:arylsulfatase [Verrucomicrobiae bacterium]
MKTSTPRHSLFSAGRLCGLAFSFLFCGAVFFSAGPVFAAAKQRPNILLIMSDDMGFSDIGCYGSEIQTPNLDALAKEGIRFTQFYNMCRCCPTRASLLTGLYPHEAGVGHMTRDAGYEGYRGTLNSNCVTIAEVLKAGGYRTYMAGKWHVTRFERPRAPNFDWPVQRGFEKFYGTIKGGGSFYDPTGLCRQNTWITPDDDPEYHPKQFYYTEALSDNAIRFLQQHQQESPDKPFFMYLAYTAAHWPMHALERDIAKYKGKYDGGYEAVRHARFQRLKQMGLIDPKWELSPQAGDWDAVTNKAWEARCMEVYAAMVDNMDQGIGRLVAELKKEGKFENTLIFFLQDNGGCAEPMGRTFMSGPAPQNLKPMRPDQLQPKVWPPMQTRDGRWVRTGPGVMPGPADTYVAYGRNWANVSNTPFREYKHWVHEGGISTPLIVHWPAGIPKDRDGSLETEPGHVIDIMATCVDVAGAKYPAEFKGSRIKPMEGVSLRPAFTGRSLNRPRPIFWEHESNRAVRDGKWKLVSKAKQPWELYDMETDRTEMHDLSQQFPEKTKELAGKWEAWAARADVLPLGAWQNTAGKPGRKIHHAKFEK